VVDLLAREIGSNTKVLILPDAHTSHLVARDQFISTPRSNLEITRVQYAKNTDFVK
jgi:hypothetical protein